MSETSSKTNLILLLNYLFHDRPILIGTLANVFTSIEEFTKGFDEFFSKTRMMSTTQISYKNRINKFDLETYLKELAFHQINFILIDSPDYPENLKNIFDPPQLLFYKGNIALLNSKIFSIVGSRFSSDNGKKSTQFIVKDLAPYFTICSGMAKGIDTIAHKTAIENHQPTIAVVATGLDQVYPAENKTLFQEIVKDGLVISEYPVGCEPYNFRFPQRNRIISGLAQGVLVTEAALKSGSLITANLALEYGREVFALPGSILNNLNQGTNRLIQDGAKLVLSADDILTEYFENVATKKKLAPTVSPTELADKYTN